jgi:general secretion pathway protein B
MSFILDALKKSESDRQRQIGPALFEVKVAPRRPGLPAWALAIAALFAVNLGIVLWILLRKPTPPPAAPPARLLAAVPTAAAEGIPATTVPPAGTGAPGAAPASQAPASAAPPAASTPAAGAPAPVATGGTAASQSPPVTPAAYSGSPSGANPDDYAPATDAPDSFGHVRSGTASGVPLYQQAAATTQLPQLRLDLHAYAPRPADRWVIINMHKLHEGDSTPEGVRVESITPEGAVLSYQGTRFLLPRD